MCTILFHFEPAAAYPLILAGNRDEMGDRPALGPDYHWPDRAETFGGLDETAGGTWMAVNAAGVFATLLNAKQSLGPADGKRSRGELPLDALDFEAAADAAEALMELDGEAYRPFNLLIADPDAAFLLQNDGEQLSQTQVGPGRYLLSHSNLNDATDPRWRTHGTALEALAPPSDPADLDTWRPWADLLRTRTPDTPLIGLDIDTDFGFQTVSRALVALDPEGKAVWWHSGKKDNAFHKVMG